MKNEGNLREMRKDWGNVHILPSWEWETGYGPETWGLVLRVFDRAVRRLAIVNSTLATQTIDRLSKHREEEEEEENEQH